ARSRCSWSFPGGIRRNEVGGPKRRGLAPARRGDHICVDGRSRPSAQCSEMIRLVDVYKSFGPKKVLQGFSLDVVEGETMVIIGYSGTGKSVAIKHIVGLLDPDEGRVLVDNL